MSDAPRTHFVDGLRVTSVHLNHLQDSALAVVLHDLAPRELGAALVLRATHGIYGSGVVVPWRVARAASRAGWCTLCR